MTLILSMIVTISVVFLFLIRVNSVKERITLHLGVLISQEGEQNLLGYTLETIKNDTTLPFYFSVALNDSMVSSYNNIEYIVATLL